MGLKNIIRGVISEPNQMEKMCEYSPRATQQLPLWQTPCDRFELGEQVMHTVPNWISGGVEHLGDSVNPNRRSTHDAWLERGIESVSLAGVTIQKSQRVHLGMGHPRPSERSGAVGLIEHSAATSSDYRAGRIRHDSSHTSRTRAERPPSFLECDLPRLGQARPQRLDLRHT